MEIQLNKGIEKEDSLVLATKDKITFDTALYKNDLCFCSTLLWVLWTQFVRSKTLNP